jgi:hypothetical protein
MRKLLAILNAMVRDGRRWDPSIPLGQQLLTNNPLYSPNASMCAYPATIST